MRDVEAVKEDLAKTEAQYALIKREGARALSRYDIEIAAGGDAQQAVETALRLLSNQISWLKAQLPKEEQLKLDI